MTRTLNLLTLLIPVLVIATVIHDHGPVINRSRSVEALLR
jgi:hypothetical protein